MEILSLNKINIISRYLKQKNLDINWNSFIPRCIHEETKKLLIPFPHIDMNDFKYYITFFKYQVVLFEYLIEDSSEYASEWDLKIYNLDIKELDYHYKKRKDHSIFYNINESDIDSPECEKCEKLLNYIDDDNSQIKLNKNMDKATFIKYKKAFCPECKKEYTKNDLFYYDKSQSVLSKIKELGKIIEYVESERDSIDNIEKDKRNKNKKMIIDKFCQNLTYILFYTKIYYKAWLESYNKNIYNKSLISFIQNFDFDLTRIKSFYIKEESNAKDIIKYINEISLKKELMIIKTNEIDYNLTERFISKEKSFYIPRVKCFLYLEYDENKNPDLFLYDYNFNLLGETKEKYLKFEIIKISDDANNDYYDFVVSSIDKSCISQLLFYKIINSKLVINYKIHLKSDIRAHIFYQLNILFKDNAILIIYGCYDFSILVYELIGNKIQKVNDFSDRFKNESDYAYIEFTYVPSLNKIYFDYKNEEDEYLVCDSQNFDYEFINDKMKNEQLNKIPMEKQYITDEFKVLFSEEDLKKEKIIKDSEQNVFNYWKNYCIDFRVKQRISTKIINNIIYIIIYDKLNMVYLFKFNGCNTELVKLCYLIYEIENIYLLDEDRFLLLYCEEGNNNIKGLICSWVNF